jgi:hypothetical protein
VSINSAALSDFGVLRVSFAGVVSLQRQDGMTAFCVERLQTCRVKFVSTPKPENVCDCCVDFTLKCAAFWLGQIREEA